KSIVRATESRPDADKTASWCRRAPWWCHRACVLWLVALSVVHLLVGCRPLEPITDSPVQRAHLPEVPQLFQERGLARATVSRDRRGRVALQGTYNNMREVDLAFSIAQTVVGPRWVSPVFPEDIEVPEWKACFERLLAGDPCHQACSEFPSVS